ncbi:hypothetical protein CXR29_03850 [Brevibacterium linens]|jgi:hypothetical protein|nr:hypothetical protein CXR29_03850 [Brevibacterium linens]
MSVPIGVFRMFPVGLPYRARWSLSEDWFPDQIVLGDSWRRVRLMGPDFQSNTRIHPCQL